MNDRPKRSSTRPSIPAPPPPSSDPRAQRRDLIQTAPDLPVPRPRPSSSELTTAPDLTPTPGPTGPSRREIKTVPGGGMNRISDGRQAASAYVGVQEPPGARRLPPSTLSKVKLASDLLVENKEFRTEPALRSQSVPPPVVQSRLTPVSPHRALRFRPGSPQAVMAVVALLAVAVGVLSVVVAGGRPFFVPDRIATASQGEVQWDHGIDGQPGVLAPPHAPADSPAPADVAPATLAPSDTAAGQPADVGPSARSADSKKSETARATSGNDAAQRPKVDPEPDAGLASPDPAASRPSPRTSPPASQPQRAPPQPWLE